MCQTPSSSASTLWYRAGFRHFERRQFWNPLTLYLEWICGGGLGRPTLQRVQQTQVEAEWASSLTDSNRTVRTSQSHQIPTITPWFSRRNPQPRSSTSLGCFHKRCVGGVGNTPIGYDPSPSREYRDAERLGGSLLQRSSLSLGYAA